MKEKFRQFMLGRYGNDSFNQFLLICFIALWVLALITDLVIFQVLSIAVMIYSYFRMFSRNISQRTSENYRFYTLKTTLTNKFQAQKRALLSRRQYHFYRCPQCSQKLRVPRGRGKIQISCPKCGKQFIKKS